jgi:hypothetical protein
MIAEPIIDQLRIACDRAPKKIAARRVLPAWRFQERSCICRWGKGLRPMDVSSPEAPYCRCSSALVDVARLPGAWWWYGPWLPGLWS